MPVRAHRTSRRDPGGGSVLLIVLVAVIAMSLSTGMYLANMQGELRATRFAGRALQSRLTAESASAYLTALLSLSDEELKDLGGLYNNPQQFQSLLVVDNADPELQGRLALVSRAPETALLRFGLQNESAKLNVNTLLAGDNPEQTAARNRLKAVPGINDSLADAILDWIDPDNVPRDYGAEESYYSGLDPAYEPRNGPIASLDELLAVRGMTPELLYGVDANRDLLLDAGEAPRGLLLEYDTSTGLLNRGIADYLTVHSLNTPAAPPGGTLTDLNSDNLEQIYNKLVTVVDEADAKFLIAYRQGDPASSGPSTNGVEASSLRMDFKKEAKRPIASLLDLVEARVQLPGENNRPPTVVNSPWKDEPSLYRDKLVRLLDAFSLGEPQPVAGLIDVNQASRSVLLSVEGLDSQAADQIISRREPQVESTDYRRYPIWLLADGIVELEAMKQAEPFLTVGGDVFTARAVGYFGSGRPVSRLLLTVDRNRGNAQVIAHEDLTPLGPGYELTELGEEAEAVP